MKNLSIFLFTIFLSGYLQAQTMGINLEELSYPYKVKFDTLQTQQQNLKMAYMYEVAGDSKGTVMLLHGKNFNGFYWGQTMQKLLSKGYNVFVPDQIGFGKSDKPEHYQYTFEQLAENTRMVMESLKIKKVIIIGHSMGGMLATRFALLFPERVDQLILENPIGLEDWRKWVPYREPNFYYQLELQKTRESSKKYMLTNYFHNEWKSDYDTLVYLQTASIKNQNYPRLAWNSALTYDMILTQPVFYEFQNLKVPTVLIIGQLDRTAFGKQMVSKEALSEIGNYPKMGKDVAGRIPNSKLIELQGLGHIPHIENFDVFFDALMKVIKP